jgi:anti-anti-sigma regulatory factor
MALQILEKNGTFEVSGDLDTETSHSFIVHFEHLMTTSKEITINIDKIKEIDASGIQALKTLFTISLKNNIILHIIGRGYKDIYADT